MYPTVRKTRQARLTSNGISLKQHSDGTTLVTLRRHRGGAVRVTVALDADAAAAVVCSSLGEGGTRNERIARVVAALEEHRCARS